jgi:hypothetical protein
MVLERVCITKDTPIEFFEDSLQHSTLPTSLRPMNESNGRCKIRQHNRIRRGHDLGTSERHLQGMSVRYAFIAPTASLRSFHTSSFDSGVVELPAAYDVIERRPRVFLRSHL